MNLSFFNFSLRFDYKDREVGLEIDLNNKNFLKDFKIVAGLLNEDLEYLEALLRSASSHKIDFFKYLKNNMSKDLSSDKRYLLWLIYQSLYSNLNSTYRPLDEEQSLSDALLCRCMGITRETIRNTIFQNGIKDMFSLTNALNVGGGCASCADDVMEEFFLIKKNYDEQDQESDVSVSYTGVKRYLYQGISYTPVGLLIGVLFPLAKEHNVVIESFIDSNIYISSREVPKEFREKCSELILKLIEV